MANPNEGAEYYGDNITRYQQILYRKNLKQYREDLDARNVQAKRILSCVPMEHLPEDMLAHAYTMLDEMDAMLDELSDGSTAEIQKKFLKWYGFLQCILVTAGIYSLDEVRSHNRGV